jgi:hypothetical protein
MPRFGGWRKEKSGGKHFRWIFSLLKGCADHSNFLRQLEIRLIEMKWGQTGGQKAKPLRTRLVWGGYHFYTSISRSSYIHNTTLDNLWWVRVI